MIRAGLFYACALVTLCAGADEFKLAEYVNSCKDDKDVSACWRQTIDGLRPLLVKGIRELQLPPVDPLFIPLLKAQRRNSNIADYSANLTDNLWIGGKDFVILENSIDPDALIFVLKLNFPKLHLHTNALIDGTILGFPLTGNKGRLEVDFANLTIDIVLNGERFAKNDKEFIRWKKEDMKIYYGDVFFQVYDLLHEPDLSVFNNAVNSNIPLLVVTIRSIIEHSIGSFIIAIVNRAHNLYATDVLYPRS